MSLAKGDRQGEESGLGEEGGQYGKMREGVCEETVLFRCHQLFKLEKSSRIPPWSW